MNNILNLEPVLSTAVDPWDPNPEPEGCGCLNGYGCGSGGTCMCGVYDGCGGGKEVEPVLE